MTTRYFDKSLIDGYVDIYDIENPEVLSNPIPYLILGQMIDIKLAQEVARVAGLTLRYLGVPEKDLPKDQKPKDLIDIEAKDANGNYTFSRYDNATMNIPVAVLLWDSLVPKTRDNYKPIAFFDPNNAVFYIWLKEVPRYFILEEKGKSKRDLLQEQTGKTLEEWVRTDYMIASKFMLGMVTIEETIHFVQCRYWLRDFSTIPDIGYRTREQHKAIPIEGEADYICQILGKLIYPNIWIY